MKDTERNTADFLERHHLDVRDYDFTDNCEKFKSEMIDGLNGSSSLAMVPTYIEEGAELPSGRPVLVLDAGGTNFRAAIVSFDAGGKADIRKFRKTAMPGVEREVSAAEFYTMLVDFIEDLVPEVDRIGFCFSYAMEKTPDRDGLLLKFSKEVKVPELEGTLVGRGVLDALAARGYDNIRKITMLNDTVATLLAGKAAGGADGYDGFIGLIIGTGINASYSEANSNIGKIPDLPQDGSQIINMESGSYSGVAAGDLDEAFRAGTVDPGSYHFEKMISGAYQGPLYYRILREAAAEGLFSEAFAAEVLGKTASEAGFTTAELSDLLSGGKAGFAAADTGDLKAAVEIAGALTDRAAFLAAVKLAAITTKAGLGRAGGRPVCICADGSTFWKLTGFKEKIEKYLTEYIGREGYSFVFTGIDNAPVIGAAVAGLTN